MARRAMRSAALVLAIAAAGTLAACSDSGDPPTQVDASKLVSAMPAATGEVDQLTYNVSGEPDTLDPRNSVTYGSGQITRNMCEALLKMDADFNVTPNLADYEQVSPTELKLTIRDGVTFWDGTPLTADDVAYSLQRAAAEDSVVSFSYIYVKKIAATGPMEVTIKFVQPDAIFVNGLATISGAVLEKAWGEQTGSKIGTPNGGLMCTGPYKFVSWDAGSGITMERNDDYWNSDLKPWAKTVDFTFISDDTALAQALDAGEVDGAYELPTAVIAKLTESKEGKVVFGPSTQSTSIAVARPDGQMADEKLRDAFQLAVDRDSIAKVIFSGAAEPNYTELTPATWPNAQRDLYQAAYDKLAAERSYDIDAAKKLVEESSYDGSDLVLAIQAGDQTSSKVAQLFQQQAKAIGVKVKLQSMPPLVFDQAGYDASKRKGIDLIFGQNFNSGQEPLEPLGFDLLPGQPYNYTEYDNPKVTELLTRARATFDENERASLILQAQEIYEPDNGLIPLVSNNEASFINNRLTGAITSFAYWSMPQMAYIGAK